MTRKDIESNTLLYILTQEALVSSSDEASAIIESVIQENDFSFNADDTVAVALTSNVGFCRFVLCEYFALKDSDVTLLLKKYFVTNGTTTENDKTHDYDKDDNYTANSLDEESETDVDAVDDDMEDVIGPGECELCERDVAKLTRHHLIPKSTWKRTESILLSRWNRAIAVPPKAPAKTNCSGEIELDEFDHLVPVITEMSAAVPACKTLHGRQGAAGRRIIRDLLSYQTIDICRPCHDHIHRSYDNRTLSLQFNTLNKLLNDPTIGKYAKWASRQHRFKIR